MRDGEKIGKPVRKGEDVRALTGGCGEETMSKWWEKEDISFYR